MATISSKWFGEGEKFARAVFTLAKKIAPSVIFIDEVDSLLGKRDKTGEHEAMRKIKNEFMSMWDGLKSKDSERVIVLAATNRPFDLDDAVLRRLPRRMLVDLPDAENREKILRVILEKEDLDGNFDFESLAQLADGFSGSDLKNLCISAAYRPIREIIQKEKAHLKQLSQTSAKGKEKETPTPTPTPSTESLPIIAPAEREAPPIRPLTLQDFEKAKEEINPSVSEDAFSIAELRKWNDMYGEGGSRQKSALTYFL